MKKFLIAVIIILCAWSLSFADEIGFGGGVNFFADYTTVSMGKINSQVDYVQNYIQTMAAGLGTPTETKLGSGFLGGIAANFDLKLMDMFSVGLGFRGGYLYAFPGSVKLNISNIYGSGYNVDITDTFSGSLIPLEIGVSGKVNIPSTGISAGLGLYGGIGIASASTEQKFTTTIPNIQNDDVTVPYSGTCAVFDIIGNVSVTMSIISVGLDLGYRIADVSQIKATQTITDNNSIFPTSVNKGDVAKDINGDGGIIDVDFGGLVVGIKVGVAF